MNEDFDYSSLLIDKGYIQSIIYSTRNGHIGEATGNIRATKNSQFGIPCYQFFFNPLIPFCKKAILDCLESDMTMLPATLTLSSEIIHDVEIMNAIKDKAKKSNVVPFVRVADEGYTLTKEDCDILSFSSNIFVDYCTSEVQSNNKVILQDGVFKLERAIVQPVLERRNNFDDIEPRVIYHINHKLSNEEFDMLIFKLNEDPMSSIELDFFDPSYYNEFLSELEKRNLRPNINIRLIGYLLEDHVEIYEQLKKYSFEIDVVYSTCHDMIDLYQEEPYVSNRNYYSQIEGGGFTSLENYTNILSLLKNFEKTVKDNNFSPLETAVYAKMQIDKDYIYDPDCNLDNTDHWDNINLSQIINHEVDGKKRAVCLGFATLYSALLRKVNIPMFRYSTRAHSRNIGRIIDEKYDVDTIGVTDITWDLESTNDNAQYTLFMNAPRDYSKLVNNGEYEPLTIATALSISHDSYRDVCPYTQLDSQRYYHPFSAHPMGYTARMLELMNPHYSDSNVIDVYDEIYNLCEEGHLEGVPKEKVIDAVKNVLQKLGENEASINDYCHLVEDSIEKRESVFDNQPMIANQRGDDEYPVELITQDNVAQLRQNLDDNDAHISYFKEYPDENNSVDEVVVNEENNDYISNLISYVTEHNITIYDYYLDVADKYLNHKEDELQEFEHSNPFIKGQEIELLTTSDDQMISLYFATSLSRVIELNVQNVDNYRDLFVDNVEVYNDSIAHSR